MAVGLRICSEIDRPPAELVASLGEMPTSVLSDAMLRTHTMCSAILPYGGSVRMVGPAFTVRVREGDNLVLHLALDLARPGDVVVVDAGGALQNAVFGELMALWAARRGLGGLVIDGAVRDSTSLAALSLPVYARGVNPRGPYKDGPGEINVPIVCGGHAVSPGDIVVGDADGVCVIPPAEADAVLVGARAILHAEAEVRVRIAEGQWDRPAVNERLKALGRAGE